MNPDELAHRVAHEMLAGEGTGPAWGIRIEEARADYARISMVVRADMLNSHGIAHGGMLVTLADTALGIALATSRTPPQPMVTVNLSTDFADAARAGDWIEAHVDIQKVGTRLAFANCYLVVGSKRILRASGVFALVPPAKPKESFEG